MARTQLSEYEAKKKKLILAKKRDRAKRRFIVLLFLLICVGTIFVVLKAPFFNVKTIVCVGQTTLSQEEVIKIAGAKTGVNVFSTGVGTMKRRLAAHPSIAESNVRRLFPNKIKIWVRESKPAICVEYGGQLLLADKNGQIIKSIDKNSQKSATDIAMLVEFKPVSSKVGEYIFNKEDAIHSVISDCVTTLDKLEMISGITKIDCTDLSDINFEYQNRLEILLGGYDQLEYKLTFIKKVIDENLSKYEKAILDYRGSKLYVAPRSEEVPPPQDMAGGNEANNDETKQTEETEN